MHHEYTVLGIQWDIIWDEYSLDMDILQLVSHCFALS